MFYKFQKFTFEKQNWNYSWNWAGYMEKEVVAFGF